MYNVQNAPTCEQMERYLWANGWRCVYPSANINGEPFYKYINQERMTIQAVVMVPLEIPNKEMYLGVAIGLVSLYDGKPVDDIISEAMAFST